jgi:4-hydroxy-tetrahydrodipicolinate synthase
MDGAIFKGVGTALITPFSERGVDYDAMRRIIDWQIDEGADFLVVLGTTGEAPVITALERREMIMLAVEKVGGRVPLVIGAGGNDTERAAQSCREAQELGADGALVVTPYYNRPSQEGLFRHYKEITDRVDIPIIAYNVPGRTGVNMEPDTALRLSALDGIVGLKEASGNIAQADKIIASVRKFRPDFAVLSGCDDQTFHIVNSGGHGVISTMSNLVPARVSRMVSLAMGGDAPSARATHLDLLPLAHSLFMETNPSPLKYAASRLGLCANILRLPLVPASQACMDRLDADLRECGVLAE